MTTNYTRVYVCENEFDYFFNGYSNLYRGRLPDLALKRTQFTKIIANTKYK